MELSETEVVASRTKYGTNDVSVSKKITSSPLTTRRLGDPIIKILLIALAIKVIVLFRNFDWYETIGILIAILLASFISVFLNMAQSKHLIGCKRNQVKLRLE